MGVKLPRGQQGLKLCRPVTFYGTRLGIKNVVRDSFQGGAKKNGERPDDILHLHSFAKKYRKTIILTANVRDVLLLNPIRYAACAKL